MNYEEFAELTRSQKITLAVIKAKQRLKNFTFVSGSTWTRVMPYYVSGLTGATYSFDASTKTLTLTSAVNPNTLEIVVEYSFFFSDFPVNQDVEYQPRLQDIGALKLELDTENTGIAIESDSSIKLENTDGFFDEIFDTLIWENQLCEFYSWSPLLPWVDRRLIYKGYISTKSFTDRVVTFNLKDSFVKLREKIPFTGTRLIYGRVANIDGLSLDTVGSGYSLSGLLSGRNDRDLLTGVISGTAGANTIAGSGTLFTTQLTAGDKLRVIDGLVEYNYTVNSIASNTSLTISGTISTSFSGATGRNANKLNNIITGNASADFFQEVAPDDEITLNGVKYTVESIEAYNSLTTKEQIKDAFTDLSGTLKPARNYRMFNRSWEVAGHTLASHSTAITTVISQRVFEVANIGHIKAGDIIKVVLDYYTVERVSGNRIFLNQNTTSTIFATNGVTKPAIQSVSYNGTSFVHGRDFTEDNDVSYCRVNFNALAEFNAASEQVAGTSLTFTYNSRTVTSLSSSLDLTTVFAPRDWIRPNNGLTTWYEISQVSQTGLTLVNVYNSSVQTYTGPALYKKPDFIGDDALVLFECMGKKSGTDWVKTPADAVKDICGLIGLTAINTASFTQAASDGDYIVSVAYPTSTSGDMPVARDAITAINKSAFGSLYSDSNFDIAYSILNADRDEAITLIKDEDIIGFTTQTKNQIVGKVKVNYKHELGTDTSSSYEYSNANIPGISTEISLDLYLFEAKDAQTIAQRYAFYRSLSQTTVTLKGKLNFITKTLNDRIYLKLDRLFKRYASGSGIKIGLVSSVNKDSSACEIQINDMGNIFSRVGSIAPNTLVDYATASEEEIARFGFVVDSNSETVSTSDDASLGTNLIG